MRGVSDALLSAIRLAEQKAVLGLRRGRLRTIRDVDIKVLCNEHLRTVSEQECSSTKQNRSCAIRLLWRSYLSSLRFGGVCQGRMHGFFKT